MLRHLMHASLGPHESASPQTRHPDRLNHSAELTGAHIWGVYTNLHRCTGVSVAEWLACWTQEQKGLGSNRSRDAVG